MAARSLGIIMDGNRRWAKGRGVSTAEGHTEGARRAKDVVRWAKERGHITDLFFYAFSTENWKRSSKELEHLLLLIHLFFRTHALDIAREGVRIRVAGQRARFPKGIQDVCADLEEQTKNNTALTVWFGLSYGGRAEILEAAMRLGQEKALPTEDEFKGRLWTADLPDPDLIIRTGGDARLSNFLTWGSVYSELFFTDTLWPDFSKEEFLTMLGTYDERERRHGA